MRLFSIPSLPRTPPPPPSKQQQRQQLSTSVKILRRVRNEKKIIFFLLLITRFVFFRSFLLSILWISLSLGSPSFDFPSALSPIPPPPAACFYRRRSRMKDSRDWYFFPVKRVPILRMLRNAGWHAEPRIPSLHSTRAHTRSFILSLTRAHAHTLTGSKARAHTHSSDYNRKSPVAELG